MKKRKPLGSDTSELHQIIIIIAIFYHNNTISTTNVSLSDLQCRFLRGELVCLFSFHIYLLPEVLYIIRESITE